MGHIQYALHFYLAPRILGPLCLASLDLEGIGSSSFTFDSHVSRNYFYPQDSTDALPWFTQPKMVVKNKLKFLNKSILN